LDGKSNKREKEGQFVKTNFTPSETWLMTVLQTAFPTLMDQFNKSHPYKLQNFSSIPKSSYSTKFDKSTNTWHIIDNRNNNLDQTNEIGHTTTEKPHKIDLGLLNGTPTLTVLPANDPCQETNREFFQKQGLIWVPIKVSDLTTTVATTTTMSTTVPMITTTNPDDAYTFHPLSEKDPEIDAIGCGNKLKSPRYYRARPVSTVDTTTTTIVTTTTTVETTTSASSNVVTTMNMKEYEEIIGSIPTFTDEFWVSPNTKLSVKKEVDDLLQADAPYTDDCNCITNEVLENKMREISQYNSKTHLMSVISSRPVMITTGILLLIVTLVVLLLIMMHFRRNKIRNKVIEFINYKPKTDDDVEMQETQFENTLIKNVPESHGDNSNQNLIILIDDQFFQLESNKFKIVKNTKILHDIYTNITISTIFDDHVAYKFYLMLEKHEARLGDKDQHQFESRVSTPNDLSIPLSRNESVVSLSGQDGSQTSLPPTMQLMDTLKKIKTKVKSTLPADRVMRWSEEMIWPNYVSNDECIPNWAKRKNTITQIYINSDRVRKVNIHHDSPMYNFVPEEHGYEDDKVPEGRHLYLQIPGHKCTKQGCVCDNHLCQIYFGIGIFVPTDENLPITFQRGFR
jgi:hypothetical protein